MFNKLKANLPIYKQDLKEKGLFFSIVDRLRRNQNFNQLYNFLKPNRVEYNGLTLFIDKEDTVVSEYLVRNKHWESLEISIFKQCLRSGDTVVDLGAHIGTYTLAASSVVGKKGRVFAFEPSPRNYAILQKNISFNRLNNVTAIDQAVSNKVGSLDLYLEAENTGDNRIYGNSNQKKVKVAVTTLDTFFPKKSDKINLMKMDIQGAELLAIKGAAQLLKKNKNLIIFTEFWPAGLQMAGSSPAALLKLLSAAEFEFYEINEAAQTVNRVSAGKLLKKYQTDNAVTTNLICAKSGNKKLSRFI